MRLTQQLGASASHRALAAGFVVLFTALLARADDGDRPPDAPAADPDRLSLPLETLRRDLDSRDYHDVLSTMIPTDLAAEWQRVATPDNYHLFARRHGGLERVQQDPRLRRAYERREQIATRFLDLMRREYAKRNLKPPFDDADLLRRTLEDADRKAADAKLPELPIRPIPPAAGAERHWPAFRGPTAQGIVLDARIPERWSATGNVVWRTKLPGRGNSSPVIWADRLFVTAEGPPAAALSGGGSGGGSAGGSVGGSGGNAPPERLLLCFDRTDGRLLWQHVAPPAREQERLYWKNSYASSTPVTDGERVIAFFGNSGLVCCDLDGERLWHRDLGTFPTTHGPGTTPVLYQDLVIIIQDQNRGPSLCAAFDKHTGEKRWQRARPNNMGWSTPVLVRVGERDELIYNGSHEVVSYDPATGEELWKLSGPSQEAIPMIVSGGGLLYSTSGRNGPTLAIRPGGNGDVSESHLVWRSQRGGPHVPSPAYHDGRLYLVSDTGIVTCFEAATGETLWQQRLRGRFSASPLVIGETLLLLNEDGVSYLLRAGPRFEVLAEHDLGEPTLATPAILDGRLYFRTEHHVLCVGQ